MMAPIKNIIFDLGGVFIQIDYPKTEAAFIAAGVTDFTALYSQHHAGPLFEHLETGKISPKEFYDQFRLASGHDLTDEHIEQCWNAMLGDFFPAALDWLEKISKQYRIFLYSNTNAIHYKAFSTAFTKQTGKKSFDDYFITAYYSHTFGLRKPYADSYSALLQKENLLAAETLFIDDTAVNIEGAKQAGLQTIHLVAPQKVELLSL
jgi:putative hydrolase of the HAD superfamily